MLPEAGWPAVLTAVPVLGSLVRAFWETSVPGLQSGSPFLNDLRDRWNKKFGKGSPFVNYSVAGARDRVVLIGALTTLGTEHRLIVDEDHISIIKPTPTRRESVEIVITGLGNQSVPTTARRRADVVVELAEKEKNATYDVFMYYGRADSDTVRDIAQRLLGVGKNPWLIEEQGVGQNWWPKLMSHIDRIDSVAIFFGTPSTAGWRKQQLLDVIAEFEKRQKPRGCSF